MFFCVDRDAQLEDEVVLCTIKVDTNGVMSIKPDFTKGSKAYKIESSGMGRGEFSSFNHFFCTVSSFYHTLFIFCFNVFFSEMFDYTLRHVSVKLTR